MNRSNLDYRFARGAAAALLVMLVAGPSLRADETLTRQASWQPPTAEQVHAAVQEWLASRDGISEEVRAQIDALWQPQDPAPSNLELLEKAGETFSLADPAAAEAWRLCRDETLPLVLPRPAVLNDEQAAPLVRNNLRLLFARRLAQDRFYDESLELLNSLQPDDVIDPATLLFYRAAAQHRLLEKEKCLETIDQLLENESLLPRRYVMVASLIRADIEPLKTDSLDEVSRLMDSIGVRLDKGRAGTRVRKEEDDVVAKLEKLIEELERQRQQQSGQSGGMNPANPMQDSMPGGGNGPGNVDPKKMAEGSWGNLPPKERQESLQQIGKEFPSHYRDVIEQYFKKLANDGGEQENP